MRVVKGMVQVRGHVYRIVRKRMGEYDVIRIMDDVTIGSFMRNGNTVESDSYSVERDLLVEIVKKAIQGAKTSWVGRLNVA